MERGNALCPQVVHVCPHCGWWKDKPFDCRHMVTATDGEPAYRDYRSNRTSFYLGGQVQDQIDKAVERARSALSPESNPEGQR